MKFKTSALIVAGFFSLALTACHADNQTNSKENAMSEKVNQLIIKDTLVGNGREAEAGFNVTVHYTGWLYDPSKPEGKGTKFDSSVERHEPFVFFLGGGQVIQGWDQGFAGMKVGGKRTLIIPPDMGYGAYGAGGVIPPNATLIFDVELLAIK
ncbi:MAG: FKBP-type peptidyl-prolyl cis-trans isomerase [Candidatus Methylopumilus sp.]|jgi:FKBP-type peptidyl-prolyl cis-trans isomerase FkpA|nr:FKBP-type peptidyl-prolyl cis-trans isomerase [Candidatus Methylopumilus sp.]NBW61235.1 FKBP-type peptidyl-prolyl cis-trans isomerase [Methylophilaceae bacterium]